jgi:hypothetical protein
VLADHFAKLAEGAQHGRSGSEAVAVGQ